MDGLDERVKVLESKNHRLERELRKTRTEVARLAAWIEGQGPKLPGITKGVPGSSKCPHQRGPWRCRRHRHRLPFHCGEVAAEVELAVHCRGVFRKTAGLLLH